MRVVEIIVSGVIIAAAAGCGVYSFSATSKPPFASVNVPQFENQTPEFQLSDRLTDAVVDAFIADNTVKVKEASQAEAIMNGTILTYRREPYTYDQQDVVSQYVVKVSMRVRVLKAASEDVIWEREFYAEGVYEANGESESDGQARVIARLTADILDKTTKSW
jgi:hypothetical protein